RGMKQRLCLAKTLLHDPKVLFLDEPASGLDPRARIEIRELLRALRNLGKTILISSHILTELADFVNKIGIIEAGGMVVTGSVADIMAQLEPYKRVHVTVGSDVPHACQVLESIEGVHNVRATDHRIELEYHGEGTQFALILPELIHAGVIVTGFGESEANLEEIFMRVTQGIVQ
ncbi:MAG: AAA family ATPase, partial [Armatimonadia bacterium]|nr:AAA family ATPase [Armatimonadia bacterium]